MEKIILDTDIGTDVDDALALAYCLRNEVNLEAITTVQGKTQIRAGIAKGLAKMFGKDIAVFAGNKTPQAEEHWIGFEGNGIKLEKYNGFLENIPNIKGATLICIGPLSNAPSLIQKLNMKRIYLMGDAKERNGIFIPNKKPHNIKVDPEAAEKVFSSNIPITIIPTELAKQFYLTKEDFERIKTVGKPWTDYLYTNSKDWLKHSKYDVFYLYDPLTVAIASNAEIIKESEVLGNIELVSEINKDLFSSEIFLEKTFGGLIK